MSITFLSGHYSIESHGNGWAYSVTDLHDGCNFWVQDDDATQLAYETNNFEYPGVLDEYMYTFGELPQEEQ